MQADNALYWIAIVLAIAWLVMLFVVFRVIAGREDLSLGAKALWLIAVFMAPILGLIAYFAISHRSVRKKTD